MDPQFASIPVYIGLLAAWFFVSERYVQLPVQLLVGLTTYHVPEEQPGSRGAASETFVTTKKKLHKPQPDKPQGELVAASKKRKAEERRAKEERPALDLGVAGNLAHVPLPLSAAVGTPFFAELDSLLSTTSICATQYLAGELLHRFTGLPRSPLVTLFCLVALFQGLRALVRCELRARHVRPDHGAILALFGVGGLVFGGLILRTPRWLINFRVVEAARALRPSFMQWLRGLLKPAMAAGDRGGPEPAFVSAVRVLIEEPEGGWPAVKTVPLLLLLPFACLAGAASALLTTPALRAARSYWLCMSPPEWGDDYFRPPLFVRTVLHAAVVLPMLSFLAWIGPAGLPLLAPRALQIYVKPGLVALWALTQLLAARPLLQSYLNGALVAWHDLKVDAERAKDAPTSRKIVKRMRATNDLIFSYLGRVATMMVAPACLLLAGAILYVSRGTPGMGTTAAPISAVGLKGFKDPVLHFLPMSPELVDASFHYLSFTSATVWLVWVTASLWMFRTGIMGHNSFQLAV
ncbi:unnamed protein product [Pedinophyceae sp. YPF-701]|nr:unnamed protein product [Pedinophyceae sp. YPF-701]